MGLLHLGYVLKKWQKVEKWWHAREMDTWLTGVDARKTTVPHPLQPRAPHPLNPADEPRRPAALLAFVALDNREIRLHRQIDSHDSYEEVCGVSSGFHYRCDCLFPSTNPSSTLSFAGRNCWHDL